MAIVRKITGECPCTKLILPGDLVVYSAESLWNPIAVNHGYVFNTFASYEDALRGQFSRPLPFVVANHLYKEGIIGPFLVLQKMKTPSSVPSWLCLYGEKYIWFRVEGSHIPDCDNVGILTHSNIEE